MSSVKVDDVAVACAVAGKGPPVVLLHCSGSSGAQWRDLVTHLAPAYRTIAPDFYGCGGTGAWPGRRALRMGDHARMVAEVIRAHGGPVHLVGHSFGGAVALRVALDHPGLVGSLTLIEPVAFHLLLRDEPVDRGLYAEIRTIASKVSECTLNGHSEAGMARFVDYWNGRGAWMRLSPSMQAALAGQIAGIATNFTALFADPTPLAAYQQVEVPTLVVRGGESPAPTRRIAEMIVHTLPSATLRTIACAGHMLPLTQPMLLARALADHIEASRPPDASAA
jgi:pimeloyl-ACP methyl ester carboxylesterase